MAIKEQEARRVVFNEYNIQKTLDKLNDGEILKRHDNPFFKGEIGVRRTGVTYGMSDAELNEFVRCKLDVHYFAENYCKIKREDGSVGKMFLRDYQKDILTLYTKNRYSILMAARQSGKCVSFDTTINTKKGQKSILELYSQIPQKGFLNKVKVFVYKAISYLEN